MLVERHLLCQKTIVEIGCGSGHFLRTLCLRGSNRGIGFDPSYPSQTEINGESPVTIYRENFPNAARTELKADFFCSRHTLEHIGDPRTFVSKLRATIAEQKSPVFVEVPNSLYTLQDGGIWDIIYEHRSYFSPSSLARLFWECDFEPVEVQLTFGNQFLTIYAVPTRIRVKPSEAMPDKLLLAGFAEDYYYKLKVSRERMADIVTSGTRVVAWGAGAKTTMFLNLVSPMSLDYVVDVNPRKHGNRVIGTGQLIVPPAFLRQYNPEVVILTNSHYLSEVRRKLAEFGLSPELLCV
jgi:hypothetical protein